MKHSQGLESAAEWGQEHGAQTLLCHRGLRKDTTLLRAVVCSVQQGAQLMGSRAHLAGTAGKFCVALPGHGLG